MELFDHLLAEFRKGAYGFTLYSCRPAMVHRASGLKRDSAVLPDVETLEILAGRLLPSRELRIFRSGVAVHLIREIDLGIRILIGGKISEGTIRFELRRMTF